MALNCKAGDLAVVVWSACGNEGKIVRIVMFAGRVDKLHPDGRIETLDCWEVDPPLREFLGGVTNTAADRQLRPIRDQPGEDESLSWTTKPVDRKELV